MKPQIRVRSRIAAVLVLLPCMTALAGGRGDYGWEWPLTLSHDDAGAYRVTLDESVYRRVQDPGMRDLVVFDGTGAAAPTALFEPEQPLARPVPRLELPWFPVPLPSATTARRWDLVSESDADGRLRRVEVRGSMSGERALADALVVDLSRVREAVAALELEWKPVEGLDLGYHVEASDDLDHWTPLATRGRLVDLQREGRQLLHRRIELYGLLPHHQRARYLRLTPDRTDQPLAVTAVTAVFAPRADVAPPSWVELSPVRTSADGLAYEFVLEGRFPVQQADVALVGNHAVEWQLESRDVSDGDWRPRAAPWMGYRVGADGGRSEPAVLAGPVRDRHWRLRASTAVSGTPTLRLGYRPEVAVFVAQGTPPYSLAAGSRRTLREDSPVPRLVDALRERHGRAWQPATAYAGNVRVLAGEQALEPRRDWRSWLLWGVLLIAALVVAGLAISLLRSTRRTAAVDAPAEAAGDAVAESTAGTPDDIVEGKPGDD
ncbi:DUF3999 domain-containing protein [Marilutibacter chinensis]|uniref:DUF3999 domain-containing protein n=1 Tax=Marilutibacter chinensis TaxID=2912247 RepID=A0ABS9HYD0_9GAMM|nr:DUF3999 domain-containing protein [Lysobacter chinensis]MCF7223368.1 DUF3999 domain-containing protein [Lysobacter chinensis]